MPQSRYSELVGKTVVEADGRRLGRVADLVAERRDEAVCIVGLLVGPGALLRRIALRRSPFGGGPLAQYIPWERVERIDRLIHLRPDRRPESDPGKRDA